MGSKGDGREKSDKSNLNQDNIIFPQSIDELPDELRQKLQAKLDANVKAFLESCTKIGMTRLLNSTSLPLEILLPLHLLSSR
jgi:hypothetical protein